MSANIVSVDKESLRKDIKNMMRKTVEETLNALLDEEASELVWEKRQAPAGGGGRTGRSGGTPRESPRAPLSYTSDSLLDPDWVRDFVRGPSLPVSFGAGSGPPPI